MSYDSKLQSARIIIESHNQAIDESGQVKFDDFLSMLQRMGGTTEDAIKQCSWEDLQGLGLPKLLARQVAKHFRADTEVAEKKTTYVSERKAAQMTVSELLERYDAKDVDNHIGARLKSKSKGFAFLVFSNDGALDLETSEKLLAELGDGYPPRNLAIRDDGTPCRPYAVGERPDTYVDENPLYPGRALRPDGTCDQTNRSWNGVPFSVRQILYVSRQNGEVSIRSVQEVHQIMDLIVGQNDMDAEAIVRTRFAGSAIELQEMLQTNRAPSLRIKIGGVGDKNDPFYAKNKKF